MSRRTIKISEEQDRMLRRIVSEDISEILNPNAGASVGNSTTVHVSATDGNGKQLPIPDTYNKYAKPLNTQSEKVATTGSLPGTSGNVVGTFTVDNSKKGQGSASMYESVLVTKGQLRKAMLRKLKENSTVMSRKDFLG